MPALVPWISPGEIELNVSPDLILPGGQTCLRAARWKRTRVSVKAELGTSNLLSREYEDLFGLHHPNILLLMATTSSYPEYRVHLVFEHVALGSLYQCLHIRPVPGLALLLNRIDVLLQVNYFLS